MSVQEAMKLLNLQENFTLEELNKNYKEKMKEWHPDICNDLNAEKMSKKINEAKEILKKYLKGENVYQYNNYQNSKKTDFETKINLIMADLRSASIHDFNPYDIYTLEDNLFINECLELAMILLMAKIDLQNSVSIDDLERIHIKFKKIILKSIKKFIEQYCKEYDLNITDFKEEIYIIEDNNDVNIESGLVSIYNNLKKISNNRSVLKKAFVKTRQFFKYLK